MGEFFTGWRRKTGVALLLVALVGNSAWIRSLSIHDSFIIPTNASLEVLSSGDQGIWWTTNELEIPGTGHLSGYPLGWYSGLLESHFETGLLFLDMDSIRTRDWQIGGFQIVETSTDSADYTRKLRGVAWRIPYWPFALPPALLSAWLILGKPRKAKGVS